VGLGPAEVPAESRPANVRMAFLQMDALVEVVGLVLGNAADRSHQEGIANKLVCSQPKSEGIVHEWS
jgi:hypothetical protein